jgi:hypothetical protein
MPKYPLDKRILRLLIISASLLLLFAGLLPCVFALEEKIALANIGTFLNANQLDLYDGGLGLYKLCLDNFAPHPVSRERTRFIFLSQALNCRIPHFPYLY